MTTLDEQLLRDFKLPDGWYCVAMSAHGYGVYVKKVRNDSLGFHKGVGFWTSGRLITYRIMFNGFLGGWVVDVDRKEGQFLFNAQPFPTYMAAIVATEIELANS